LAIKLQIHYWIRPVPAINSRPSVRNDGDEELAIFDASVAALEEGKVTSQLPSPYPEGSEPGPDILSVTSAARLYGALVVGVNV
jgi:hypothetical protein